MQSPESKINNLEMEEAGLFGLFHPMPNTEKRERLYKKWLSIRKKISEVEYGK